VSAVLWPLADRSLLVVDEDEERTVIDLRGDRPAPLARGVQGPDELGAVLASRRPATLLVVSAGLAALGLALDAIAAMPDGPALEVRASAAGADLAQLCTTPRADAPQLRIRLSGRLEDAARCRAVLSAWFHDDVPTEVLLLVVSELVTNAIRYGSGQGHLELTVVDRVAWVGVDDGAATVPRPRENGSRDGGFGLRLVHRTCRAWGIAPREVGKQVWAEVLLG